MLKSLKSDKGSEREEVLRELIRKVRRVELSTRRLVNEVFAGEYHSVFKGRGMEFIEVREYVPGDEVRSIDWNVTARFGAPFVKVFAEERELSVLLVVDASSSLLFGTQAQAKSELALELCALLAFSAIRNNDRVGLIIFTDRIELYLPPRKGREYGLRLIRELVYFKPRRKGTDLSVALDFLFRVQKRRAVVFLLSDFFTAGYEEKLKIAKHRYDFVAISLNDLREKELPSLGLIELEDLESGELVVVDSSEPRVREEFRRSFEERRRVQEGLFSRMELDVVHLFAGEPYERRLVKFFRERARRVH